MKNYIFLTQDGIGGAEKRFAGLWCNLVTEKKTSDEYYLVLTESLYNDLLKIKDYEATLLANKNLIVFHNAEQSFFGQLIAHYKLLKKLKSKDAQFHYIEFFPFIKPLGTKIIFSITASNFNIYSFKGKMLQYISNIFANKIDVLDPVIYERLKKIFFYKKNNFFLTPCTFCNYDKLKIEPKQNWIVFLGIFTPIKQPIKYLKTIPAVVKKLEILNLTGLKFLILGNGVLENELLAEAKNEIYNGLPIEIKFTSNPEEILNKSKVFISTQLFNNYPSRSLVEALAAGNLPVVTDNGQTRWIAKENFSYYVKEDFSETDIADAVYEIMKLDNNAFIEKANIARVFVTTNHTLKKMSNYFQEKIYA